MIQLTCEPLAETALGQRFGILGHLSYSQLQCGKKGDIWPRDTISCREVYTGGVRTELKMESEAEPGLLLPVGQ